MFTRKIKLFSCFFLVSCLVVLSLPHGKFVNAAEESVFSGDFGSHIKYTARDLDDDGLYDVLEIKGYGYMPDFCEAEGRDSYIPDEIINSVETVIFDYGIDSIGSNFLKDAINVKEIVIPASVKKIGDNAIFNNDSNLKIKISGESPVVAEIYSAYPKATYFTSDYKGVYCSNISYISRDANNDGKYDSLVFIGKGDMSAGATNVFPDFIKNSVNNILVPYGIYSIGESAFSDFSSLRKITLPINLKEIKNNAFENCTKLNSISIPTSVTSIGDNVFAGCNSMARIDLPPALIHLGKNSIPRNEFVEVNCGCDYEKFEEIVDCQNSNVTINLSHNEVDDELIPPTCTEKGRVNATHCSICNIKLKNGISIPATGHKEVPGEYIEPGCTTVGRKDYTKCEYCNEIIDPGFIYPPGGHAGYKESIDSTCSQEGYIDRIICSKCNYILDEGTIIPLKDHRFVQIEGKEPTCTEMGLSGSIICADCYYVTYPNHPLPALGHNEVSYGVAKEATCTETGLIPGTKCDRCNEVLEEQTIVPAKGHVKVIDPAVPATTKKGGYTEGSHCSVCKIVLKEQKYIPPIKVDKPKPTPTTVPAPTPAIKPTPAPSKESGVEGFCERLYTIALGRASDPKGKSDWVAVLKDGSATGADVAYGFFFSPEFVGKGLSNKEYVTRLYRTFMDREPDAAGFNAWVKALDEGAPREKVFAGFTNSVEWANICQRYGIRSGGSANPTIG